MWAEGGAHETYPIPALNSEQLDALEELYRTAHQARLRTRAQIVLLAAERRLSAAQIAGIVRASEETVRAAGSSATWQRVSRGCATCLIRVRRAR